MADLKISALTALTTPNVADLFVIVDDIGGTATTKKITLANSLKDITIAGGLGGTTWTGTGKIATTVTTEQLRLSYDSTNYIKVTVADDGHTTFQTVDADGAEADINFIANGNVGIATAAPSEALHVTGAIKASTDLDVGNDVLLYDGAVVGITGNEVITWDAAGTINFTGCSVDIDGAFTATSVGSDTGFVAGTVAVGLTIANSPTGISFTDVGATGEQLFDVVDAYCGAFIETGTYQSSASGGITLHASNQRPVAFVFDDAGATLGSGNYRGVISRIYLAGSQAGQVAIRAIRGQLKVASTKNLTIGTNEMNALNGIEGYIEMAGTHTVGANARVAAVHGLLEVNDDITLTAGGYMCGLFAELSQVNSKTVNGVGTAGLMIDRLDSDHSTNQVAWTRGIVIQDSSCATGIDIGNCTTGLVVTGTSTTAISVTGIGAGETDGWDGSSFAQYGTYNTAVVQGTVTKNLVHQVINTTGAVTGSTKFIMGNVWKFVTSAASTGIIYGFYGRLTISHDIYNCYSIRGRIIIDTGCKLGETGGIVGHMEIGNSLTLTQDTGGYLASGIFGLTIGTGCTIPQDAHGISVRAAVGSDIAGVTCGIKVDIPGTVHANNYLDYGIDIDGMTSATTAGMRIRATMGSAALATGIVLEGYDTTTSTITDAIAFVGTITNAFDFAESNGSQAAVVDGTYASGYDETPTGSIRVDVAGQTRYIYLHDTVVGVT